MYNIASEELPLDLIWLWMIRILIQLLLKMLALEFLMLSIYILMKEGRWQQSSDSFCGHSLLRQGLHCFSLKISPKRCGWILMYIEHAQQNNEQLCNNCSIFSRFQSEHSCGAKSWLCTYPSGPALTGQAECLLSRALGRSQLAEVINTTHTGSSRRQAAIYSLPDQTRGGPLRIERSAESGPII